MIPLLLPFSFLVAGSPPAQVVHASMAVQHSETAKPGPAKSETDLLFDQYQENLWALQFDQALVAADRIKVGANNKPGQAILAAMRASALLGLKRDKEARSLIDEAERLAPEEPAVNTTLFLGANLTERFDVAANSLDRLIARAPDQVREIDLDVMWFFLRNQPEDQETRNDDRRVALARLGFGGDASPGDYFALRAVEILIKRGDLAGATELVSHIDEPQVIENLLIQRRYSALWPKLEAQAGPHLERVRASAVASADREFAAAPDDTEKLQQLINALRHAGRLDRAIAYGSKLPKSREAMSSADEQMGWAVNNVALALHEAGRADEADRLFALLNEAPMENDGWRVSMLINRLELLVTDGKYDRALPLVEPTAKAPGSPYAQQLVRRLRYCTFSGLGRKAEAAKLLPELLAHAGDAPGPTIDGLICAGELDQAEKLALATLKKKDDFNEDFVRQLQARPLTSDDPSVWAKGWQELRHRPAIAAEFNRLGRDMPEEYLPPKPELTGKPDPADSASGWTAEG